jgi:hypothetical protein
MGAPPFPPPAPSIRCRLAWSSLDWASPPLVLPFTSSASSASPPRLAAAVSAEAAFAAASASDCSSGVSGLDLRVLETGPRLWPGALWSGASCRIPRRPISGGSAVRSLRSGRCGGSRRIGGSAFLGSVRFAEARHLERPIFETRFAADVHLFVNGVESKHFDLDFPHTGRQIQTVAPGIVGIRYGLGVPLAGGNGGSGDELICGPDRTAIPGRAQDRRPHAGSTEQQPQDAMDQEGPHAVIVNRTVGRNRLSPRLSIAGKLPKQ